MYCVRISWKGEAKLTPAVLVATLVVLSVSGTSEGGRWASLDEPWAWKAFRAALAASCAISRVDCCTVSLISCHIACSWPSVNSYRGAAVWSLLSGRPGCAAGSLVFWPGNWVFKSWSRRSRVFRTPVDGSPCWTQRERRSMIDRTPKMIGSVYGGTLRRVDLLWARGGMTCAVARSEILVSGKDNCTEK